MQSDVLNPTLSDEIISRRKSLIPTWIKVIGWLFIIMGAVLPLFHFYVIFTGGIGTYMMFGWSYQGPPLAMMAMFISALILINACCAYGLLFAKDWGLTACILFGYVGLLLAIMSMFFADGIKIALEPLVQIPYLIRLHKIKAYW